MSEYAHVAAEDIAALRAELRSLRARQAILADALEAVNDDLEHQEERRAHWRERAEKAEAEVVRLRAMIEYEGLDPDYRGGPKGGGDAT